MVLDLIVEHVAEFVIIGAIVSFVFAVGLDVGVLGRGGPIELCEGGEKSPIDINSITSMATAGIHVSDRAMVLINAAKALARVTPTVVKKLKNSLKPKGESKLTKERGNGH